VITLLTGAPGAGKTALLVEWLRTLYADRPIFVHGLNGLTLPHVPVDAAKWHTELPDGAILVVDEAQQVWRPRGPGHAPSAAVQEMETHRHRDIDIFLTTQKPNLIDSNIRGLVGRHVHIRDTGWLGRYIYEWPECSENLAWKTCVIKRKFKLPAKAFSLYKSATGHTGSARTKSVLPWITAGLVGLALVLAFLVYRAIASKTAPPVAPGASAHIEAKPIPARDSSPAPGRGQAGAAAAAWPVYESGPVVPDRDPYAGRAIQLEGQWTVGGVVHGVFGVLVNGERVATASLGQLVRMGYSWTDLGPCSGLLRHGDRERVITCAPAPHRVEARGEGMRSPSDGSAGPPTGIGAVLGLGS